MFAPKPLLFSLILGAAMLTGCGSSPSAMSPRSLDQGMAAQSATTWTVQSAVLTEGISASCAFELRDAHGQLKTVEVVKFFNAAPRVQAYCLLIKIDGVQDLGNEIKFGATATLLAHAKVTGQAQASVVKTALQWLGDTSLVRY